MENEPRWVTVAEIIEFNRLAVLETGEPFTILDEGLLESAWANPKNRWHYGEVDVATLAVALMLAVARNHPFEQGNKRAAFAAADAFMYLNGWDMGVPDYSEFADLIIQAITGDIEEDELVSVIAYSAFPA